MKKNSILFFAALLTVGFSSCSDDDAPPAENPEEVITKVTLTFTPVGGGSAVTFTATDPDGEGPQDMAPDQTISLISSTQYSLDIDFEGLDGEDIGAEVDEEAEEHQLFFSWTDGIFASPVGDGNIDNQADDVNYDDSDAASLPLGLMTSWETAASGTGNFRVVLKHQPDVKSASSSVNDGETDVDISWSITLTP